MVFKKNWESACSTFKLEPSFIETAVSQVFGKVYAYEVIPEGSIHINIKVLTEENGAPLLLRLHLGSPKDSAFEAKLVYLLQDTIPLPKIFAIGKTADFQFVVREYCPGIPLSALLLKQPAEEHLMQEVGMYLAKIQNHTFPTSGVFDNELHIKQTLSPLVFANSFQEYLSHPNITSRCSTEELTKIRMFLEKYHETFPNIDNGRLVHGDFDPSNILVEEVDGKWKITGIIDWEHAFSYSPLWDVATMLKEAHSMPSSYTTNFLKGLQKGGIKLPENWQIGVHMINLLIAMRVLGHCPPQTALEVYSDMQHILSQLEKLA